MRDLSRESQLLLMPDDVTVEKQILRETGRRLREAE